MRHTLVAGILVSLVMSWVLIGCDWKPSPPATASGSAATKITLSPNPQEEQLVNAVELAFANYHYRLLVIREYYFNIGNMNKHQWAQEELTNLETARTFEWEGLKGKVQQPAGESVQNADEMLLAEYVVGARNEYLRATEALQKFYESTSEDYKARLIRNMRDRLNPERCHTYFTNAEVPGPDLKARDVIPEAEKLYTDALALYKAGKILPAVVDYKKERAALTKFIELVHHYPNSTRIALSAYYIGEIYKEYFNEDTLAVRWYERAWQWDPAVPEDARFQAAVTYDYRLHNRDMALALYREVIKNEQNYRTNIAWANQRIKELTEKK